MSTEKKITSSSYRKIAIDLAENIVNGKYLEGQKLFGRSVLASHYSVSPETIRKAVHILKDMGIVDTEKGSGVQIISVDAARAFLERNRESENISEIKKDIMNWAQAQIRETSEIVRKIQYIVDSSNRSNNISPFTHYEIVITEDSAVIGKTADELHFWHNTGGTIIAIRRGEEMIVSPGPYATFNKGDVVYIVGDEHAYAATIKLIFG